MGTLETTILMLQALKRYRESMTPAEREAYDKRTKEDPMGMKAFFRPNPIYERLCKKDRK